MVFFMPLTDKADLPAFHNLVQYNLLRWHIKEEGKKGKALYKYLSCFLFSIEFSEGEQQP
jgi:hypothetical protein